MGRGAARADGASEPAARHLVASHQPADSTDGWRRQSRLPWLELGIGALGVWAWFDVVCGRVPGWPEAAGFAVGLAGLAAAVTVPRLHGLGSVTYRGGRAQPWVALTFDDGPDPHTTPQVLATLRAYGVQAAFFVIGAKARAHPDLVGRIAAAGHDVGCHSDRHDWRTWLRAASATRDLETALASIEATAPSEISLFRPPYGIVTPPLAHAVRRLGLHCVGWSRRSFDTRPRGDPSRRALRLAKRSRAGDIILLHDAPQHAGAPVPHGVAMLPTLIDALRERGLEPVGLSQLLGS